MGAFVIEFPTIKIEPNPDKTQINQMLKDLKLYQWIIFTSTNGVDKFFEYIQTNDIDIREIGNAKICAIGASTKKAIERFCLKVEFIPDEYVAEALVKGLKILIKPRDRVLIPRAETAREVIPEELKKLGALVDVVPLYKTVIPEYQQDYILEMISKIDTITFTSSSTVKNFVEIIGNDNLKFLKDNKINIACIGPITADTVEKSEMQVSIIAEEYTIDGLVKALGENK